MFLDRAEKVLRREFRVIKEMPAFGKLGFLIVLYLLKRKKIRFPML